MAHHTLPAHLDWTKLTPREYRIAWLLHHGLSYAEIGRDFKVSGQRIAGIWKRALQRGVERDVLTDRQAVLEPIGRQAKGPRTVDDHR